MTLVIYFCVFPSDEIAFFTGLFAFTFPMAIGATALYKMANLVSQYPQASEYASQLHILALGQAVIATAIIGYVSIRFIHNYLLPHRVHVSQSIAK